MVVDSGAAGVDTEGEVVRGWKTCGMLGMTVEVVIPKRIKNNVLYLPPEYVYTDKNGEYALNADKKKVKIKTGMKTMDAVEVLEGLREGEVVSRVRVLDPDEFDVVRL